MTTRNRATDERPPIIIIDQAVIDDYNLHPLAGWLYVVIVRHVNRKKNDAFPSISRLAKLAHMSKASVLRYTKVLEQAGLIAVERDDSTGDYAVNHYRLLPVKGGVSQKQVVSDSNYLGIPQQPQVVSDSNTNHIEDNQKKEPVKARAQKTSDDFDDVPKDDRLQIIRAWAEALSAPPIGAYKNDANHRIAAEIFRAGYRAPQVALFVREKKKDGYWRDKTLTLQKVAQLMPEWLMNLNAKQTPPPEVVQRPNLVPVEWGVNHFVRKERMHD